MHYSFTLFVEPGSSQIVSQDFGYYFIRDFKYSVNNNESKIAESRMAFLVKPDKVNEGKFDVAFRKNATSLS